jgi:hypothetical protein
LLKSEGFFYNSDPRRGIGESEPTDHRLMVQIRYAQGSGSACVHCPWIKDRWPEITYDRVTSDSIRRPERKLITAVHLPIHGTDLLLYPTRRSAAAPATDAAAHRRRTRFLPYGAPSRLLILAEQN